MSRLVRVIALAPAGTPKAITEALNLEIRRIANSEEFKPVLERNSLVANQLTPADTRERVKRDYAYWSALVKQLGIRPDYIQAAGRTGSSAQQRPASQDRRAALARGPVHQHELARRPSDGPYAFFRHDRVVMQQCNVRNIQGGRPGADPGAPHGRA